MTEFTPLAGLMGGVLIGLSAVVLMGAYGRVAGLSGIFGGLFTAAFDAEFSWRAIFMAGLLGGAVLAGAAGWSDIAFSAGPAVTVIGGLLVGVGTALGSGCTSGHGICGLSRLSRRSLVSTLIFMGVAIATVFVVRHVIGGG